MKCNLSRWWSRFNYESLTFIRKRGFTRDEEDEEDFDKVLNG